MFFCFWQGPLSTGAPKPAIRINVADRLRSTSRLQAVHLSVIEQVSCFGQLMLLWRTLRDSMGAHARRDHGSCQTTPGICALPLRRRCFMTYHAFRYLLPVLLPSRFLVSRFSENL